MIDGGRDSPATERTLRACPVCREPRRVEVGRKADLVLMRCVACGMTYLDPAVSRLADDRYYDAGGRTFYLNAGKVLSDYSPVRFERELRCFRRHVPAGRVLDVGCSTGGFLHQLKTRFPGQYQTVGTDISSEPVRHAVSQGVDARCGDFLAMDPRELGRFAAVTFWAVLEHLLDPGAFLRHAASLLEPDGRCFVLVPNHRSLAVRLLGTKYRYVLLEHVNYFNADTLRTLCGKGFEVVEAGSTHFNPAVLWQDATGRGRAVTPEDRIALLQQTTAMKQSRRLAPLRPLYRGVEALLGRFQLADNLLFVLRPSR